MYEVAVFRKRKKAPKILQSGGFAVFWQSEKIQSHELWSKATVTLRKFTYYQVN